MTKLVEIEKLAKGQRFLYRRKDGAAIVLLEVMDFDLHVMLVAILEASHPKIPKKIGTLTYTNLREGTVWVGDDLGVYFDQK